MNYLKYFFIILIIYTTSLAPCDTLLDTQISLLCCSIEQVLYAHPDQVRTRQHQCFITRYEIIKNPTAHRDTKLAKIHLLIQLNNDIRSSNLYLRPNSNNSKKISWLLKK